LKAPVPDCSRVTRYSDTACRSRDWSSTATDNNEYRAAGKLADGAPKASLFQGLAYVLRKYCWIIVNGEHHGPL